METQTCDRCGRTISKGQPMKTCSTCGSHYCNSCVGSVCPNCHKGKIILGRLGG